MTKFRGEAYTEILIEYSLDGSCLYVNGLDTDQFWEEVLYLETEDVLLEVDTLKKGYESLGFVVTLDNLDEAFDESIWDEDN